MLILYGSAAAVSLVLALVIKGMPGDKRVRFLSRLRGDKTVAELRKVNPSKDALMLGAGFTAHKLTVFLLIICAGLFLAFMYELKEFNSDELIDGRLIMRNGYGRDEKKVRLKVRSETYDDEDIIEISVSERRYTDEELDVMADEVEEELYELILGDNESLDRICTDMTFPSALEGYPFRLSWRTDDPLLLNNKGILDKERLGRLNEKGDAGEGVLTGIHAEFIYEDYLRQTDFCARIYPSDTDRELTLPEYLSEVISEEDKATRTEEYLRLPVTAGDTAVSYDEAGSNRAAVIAVMALILAAGMYYREDKKLADRVKERDMQLIADYPGMINKFVLFYSAGLTTRGIWSKLCRDYRSRLNNGEDKRYLYEEMLICEGRMNEGLGEINAYEGFAARLGLHKYRQFISLIGQAAGKGRADLLPLLEREAAEAFLERKNRAKELGEKAGTRLLFPMLMMLITVLIIVMVPAFISFRN